MSNLAGFSNEQTLHLTRINKTYIYSSSEGKIRQGGLASNTKILSVTFLCAETQSGKTEEHFKIRFPSSPTKKILRQCSNQGIQT